MIETQYIIPVDITTFCQTFYDPCIYWMVSGTKLDEFICSDSVSFTKPAKGDRIRLSNGRDGTITKFGCIYDNELIGIQLDLHNNEARTRPGLNGAANDSNDVINDSNDPKMEHNKNAFPDANSINHTNNNIENNKDDDTKTDPYGSDTDADDDESSESSEDDTPSIGSYGKLQGFTGANARYNDIIVKLCRFKYSNTNHKKQMLVQDNDNIYIIFQDQFKRLDDFTPYKQSLSSLKLCDNKNDHDIIWRSSAKVRSVQLFDIDMHKIPLSAIEHKEDKDNIKECIDQDRPKSPSPNIQDMDLRLCADYVQSDTFNSYESKDHNNEENEIENEYKCNYNNSNSFKSSKSILYSNNALHTSDTYTVVHQPLLNLHQNPISNNLNFNDNKTIFVSSPYANYKTESIQTGAYSLNKVQTVSSVPYTQSPEYPQDNPASIGYTDVHAVNMDNISHTTPTLTSLMYGKRPQSTYNNINSVHTNKCSNLSDFSLDETKEDIDCLDGMTTQNQINDHKVSKLAGSSRSRLVCHGKPMWLKYINYNNILIEFMVFPFGDEFGRTFSIAKVQSLPVNIKNITAIITFECNQITVEYESQKVVLHKNGQIIEWDSLNKYLDLNEWRSNYQDISSLDFSLNINILEIEFNDNYINSRNRSLSMSLSLSSIHHKPITLKEQLILEICLIHNDKLESLLQEMKMNRTPTSDGLIFYSDQNWRFYLEPKMKDDDELKMSIELMLLPPKIIAIELEISIGNNMLQSNGKQFLFGADGYDNICTIAFSNYLNRHSIFEVVINILKVINNEYHEVPKSEWDQYNIIYKGDIKDIKNNASSP